MVAAVGVDSGCMADSCGGSGLVVFGDDEDDCDCDVVTGGGGDFWRSLETLNINNTGVTSMSM